MQLLSKGICLPVFTLIFSLSSALNAASAQDVAVTVSLIQDFDKKPVPVNDTTKAIVKATATTPVPPAYCTVDPPGSWKWTWEVVSAPANASVSIIPDAADPSLATVSVSFSAPGDYHIIVQASVSIGSSCGASWAGAGQIDLPISAVSGATVYFEFSSWTVNEDDGTATITVGMDGTPTGPVSVKYATKMGGTATPGKDYIPVTGTLSWSPSQAGSAKTFTIKIMDDNKVEPAETINMVLSNPVNATLGLSMAVLYILDDDVFEPCPP